jgi:hypothetical protein
MPKPRQVGQTGPKPEGPKQNQMPINHARNPKAPGVQNRAGGAHPAARRALAPKASSHAQRRASASSTPGAAVSGPGAGPVGGLNQDSLLNQSNAMDQDAGPGLSSNSDFGGY